MVIYNDQIKFAIVSGVGSWDQSLSLRGVFKKPFHVKGMMVEERESGRGKIQKPQKKNPVSADLAVSFSDLARPEKRGRGDRSPSFFSPSAGDARVNPSFDGEDPLALLSAAAAAMS